MDQVKQLQAALSVAIQQRNNSEDQIISLNVALQVAAEKIKELEDKVKDNVTQGAEQPAGTD